MFNKTGDDDKKLEYIDNLNANKKNYDYINNKTIKTKKKNRRKKRKN